MRPLLRFNFFDASALIGALILFCAPLAAQTQKGPNTTTTRTPTFSVRGKVMDAEERAQIEGARVELRSFTGATIGAMLTRAAGDFEFLNLTAGFYDITAQQAGYHTVTLRLGVNDSVFGLTIDLHPDISTRTVTPGPSSVSARELSVPRKAREAMDKGLVLMNEKSNYLASVKQFERAIQAYPEYYEAYTQIGIAYLHRGDYVSAEPALRKAMELSGFHYVDALFLMATLLNNTRRFVDAEAVSRGALEMDSDCWQANLELARSLLGLNRPAEAEKNALAASKSQPDNAMVYLILANVHSQVENAPALLEDLNNYLRLAPIGPMADQARAQQKQLQDELRETPHALPIATPDTSLAVSREATNKVAPDTPNVAISVPEDSPAVKFAENERKPVLWPPTNVDADVPPVAPGLSCPLQVVLKGARKRVQELLENVDRFTATEVIDFDEIGQDGRALRSLKYTFDYLAAVSLSRDGDLRFEESRKETGKINPTPIPIRTVGLAVGAAVFHPLRFDDFKTTCEGLGQWHGKPAWQLRFEQRPDKPPRFQAVFDNDHWYDVKLKGRVWVSPESSQIEHIDFDLLEAIEPIRLQTEHMSIDYRAVAFPKRKLQLWLPESVSFYIDVGGRRFLNRHELSDYVLFSVDTDQQIKAPLQPN